MAECARYMLFIADTALANIMLPHKVSTNASGGGSTRSTEVARLTIMVARHLFETNAGDLEQAFDELIHLVNSWQPKEPSSSTSPSGRTGETESTRGS
jgi:hypothetical protein